MSKDLRFPGSGSAPDNEMRCILGPSYEAPADSAYWDDLHRRIMQRVRSATPDEMVEWWMVLSRWARVGAVAAVVIAVLSGTLLLQYEQRVARLAYEAVLNQPPTYSFQLNGERDASTSPSTDPILRYGLP